MSLAAPHYLWALAVLPLLWWLSLPPRPQRHVFTAHLEQWRAALTALRRRPPRGSALRFVLLALALVAAALAAARPFVPGAPGARRLVVLLDSSASMAARGDDGTTAFQRATARLAEAFATLPPPVDVTLLRCGGALLRRHGASARHLHDVGDPGGAIAVDLPAVARAAAAEPDTAVWTLTDGQGQERLPVDGALSLVGKSAANAAIVALRFDDQWPLPTLPVELDVVAFPLAAGPVSAQLAITGAVAPRTLPALTLQPGAVTTVPLVLERAAAGGDIAFTLAVNGDRLGADDAFTLALPPLPAPRIAYLAEPDGGPFAQVAAEALAAEVGGVVTAPDSGEDVGLLLVDGGVAAIEPGAVRALTFGSRLAGDDEPQPWFAPAVRDWQRSDALTAGLDLSELRVERAWRGVLPPGEPFLWADDGDGREPLAVIVRGRGTASVHFAFRLQDGNLWSLAAFPQLLRRAFVTSYGTAAVAAAKSPAPAAGEIDLTRRVEAPDRPLPQFAGADLLLARWFVLAGLVLLALRAWVR